MPRLRTSAGAPLLAATTAFLSSACGGCSSPPEALAQPPVEDGCAPAEVALPDGRCQKLGPPDARCAWGERALSDGVWIHDTGRVSVQVLSRASATVRGALIERNREIGAFISGSEVAIEASAVRATQPDGAGQVGWGVAVQLDRAAGVRGKLAISGSLIEQNHESGVFVGGSDTTIAATVVRDTSPNGAGNRGWGVAVQDDPRTGERGKLAISGSHIATSHTSGVRVAGSEATMDTTVVRDTRPSDPAGLGVGIELVPGVATGGGGALALSASLVAQNHGMGVRVVASEATIEGTVVSDNQPGGTEESGWGIVVERGKLAVSASLIERNQEVGVFVLGSEATIDATAVRDTRPDASLGIGRGVEVQTDLETGERGKLAISASLVEQSREIGIFVLGSDAAIDATVVRATEPNGAGNLGHGIRVQEDRVAGARATLALSASLIEQSHQVGVLVAGADATIAATIVRATQPSPIALDIADGVLVVEDSGPSDVVISGSESTENGRAGVLFMGSAGAVSGVRSVQNRFGLVVQRGESGAQPTIGEGNVFDGNKEESTVSDGALPVPDATPALP